MHLSEEYKEIDRKLFQHKPIKRKVLPIPIFFALQLLFSRTHIKNNLTLLHLLNFNIIMET